MENKNLIISAILIIAVLGFVSNINITGYVTDTTCTDSDQGKDSNLFGICKTGGTSYKDSCLGNNLLAERYCDSKKNCAAASIHCSTKCVEGVCVKEINVGVHTVHAKDIYLILDSMIKVNEVTEDGSLILDVNGVIGTVEVEETKLIDNIKFKNLKASNLDDASAREVSLSILFPTYYLLALNESITIDQNIIIVKQINPPRDIILNINDDDYEIKTRMSKTINSLIITNVDIINDNEIIINTNNENYLK